MDHVIRQGFELMAIMISKLAFLPIANEDIKT